MKKHTVLALLLAISNLIITSEETQPVIVEFLESESPFPLTEKDKAIDEAIKAGQPVSGIPISPQLGYLPANNNQHTGQIIQYQEPATRALREIEEQTPAQAHQTLIYNDHRQISNQYIAPTESAYKPAAGPLILGFQSNGTLLPYDIGLVFKTILKDDELVQELKNCFISLNAQASEQNIEAMIHHIENGQLTYQQLMSYFTQNPAKAKPWLLLIEKALTKLYQEYSYIFMYPGLSKLYSTGLRYPTCWIQDSKQVEQLTSELDQVADIAMNHHFTLGTRLKAKVKIYKNWRSYTYKTTKVSCQTAVAYLIYNKASNFTNLKTDNLAYQAVGTAIVYLQISSILKKISNPEYLAKMLQDKVLPILS